jgi:tetratricopeptide (TPR) repeat protein
MSQRIPSTLPVVLLAIVASCGPAPETVKPAPVPETKEMFYQRGHQLYLEQQFDSAQAMLRKAVSLDASYAAPLTDLAQMHYDLGMRVSGEKSPQRLAQFKKAHEYFARIDALGIRESDLYERLCELSYALGDDRAYLKYAKKNAEAYPYDRQYFNLGSAYFMTGEYQNVIKTQKEAIGKFKSSPYIGSFYRQLGRAYMKIERDQTAERTFDAGIRAVDGAVAELKKTHSDFTTTEAFRRLHDDKIGMLVSLKGLHQTYRAADKLKQVEKQLQEAGYRK